MGRPAVYFEVKRLMNRNMVVEVFKTNVEESYHARMLVEEIHHRFPALQVNFDLEDCDKILRVKTTSSIFYPEPIIQLLNHFGFHAEVLTDEIPGPGYGLQDLLIQTTRPVQDGGITRFCDLSSL